MIQIERQHFGVLVPSTNTTVEIEYTNHLPATLQFHTARLGKGSNTPFSPGKDDDVIYQSKMLGDARVESTIANRSQSSGVIRAMRRARLPMRLRRRLANSALIGFRQGTRHQRSRP